MLRDEACIAIVKVVRKGSSVFDRFFIAFRVRESPAAPSSLVADIAMEDLLSLLAVLDRWVFHIDSPDRSLGDVSGWVQRSMRCEKLDINPHYLLSSPAGPSAIMLFLWQQKTPFSGELSVHCR